MFPWKIITEIPEPTVVLDFVKVALGISVIDFWGKIFMSSDRFQNLQNKFLFNLRRRSTLYNFCFASYGQDKMSKNVTLWQSYVDKPMYKINYFTRRTIKITWWSYYLLFINTHYVGYFLLIIGILGNNYYEYLYVVSCKNLMFSSIHLSFYHCIYIWYYYNLSWSYLANSWDRLWISQILRLCGVKYDNIL